MKVSVITAVINSAKTIEGCIQSVLSQSHKDVEHIIIDGASWDGTLDIIGKYKDKIAGVVSEPDNGIYDALNKGISLASGDIVGFLHAGDFYAHNKVLETVVDVFKKQNVDSCYGDIQYVDKNNTDRVIRYWKSSKITPQGFIRGWMPPHPSFFVRLWVYKKYGFFKAEFKIDFLDDGCSLIVPIREDLFVNVLDSFTKSKIVC
ncbi:MAG: glycosyltransferase family 2 protein [Candidatus Omnitrophica bacterium]|nr:glycosyltransferase family 2 protein [Candidatus Omnitrophota bacterium]